MGALDLPPGGWLVLVLILAVIGAVALWAAGEWLGRKKLSWRSRRRMAQAQKAEREAERLLIRKGYRVLDDQVPAELSYFADEEQVRVSVRADLLVKKDGRRYVAEVKSGAQAPKGPRKNKSIV